MKEKTKIRPILFEEWQIEKTESWLEAMAAKGWLLKKAGRSFAKFQKSEPALVRYRCDVDAASPLNSTERLAFYESAGWKKAGSRPQTSIYCSEDPSAPEIHTEPYELANILNKLQPNVVLYSILLLCLSLAACWMFFSDIFMKVSMLLDFNLIPFLMIFFFYQWIVAVRSKYHLSSVIRKLRTSQQLQHSVPYKMSRLLNGIVITALKAMLIAALVLSMWQLIANWPGNRYQPIPTGELAVVRMSDITGNAQFQPDKSKYENYFRKSWSIWVPEQTELGESGILYGIKLNDGSQYTPDLTSQRYRALTPGLARYLAEKLAETSMADLDQNGTSTIKYQGPSSELDGLWTYDSKDGMNHEILALRGCYVYHITFYGVNKTDELVSLLRIKAASAN